MGLGIVPEFVDAPGETGKDEALDGLLTLEETFSPDVAVAHEDGHPADLRIDDPVFTEAVGEVFLPLGLIVAGLAAGGDDLDGERGGAAAPWVLGGAAEDHGHVGIPPRDHAGSQSRN